MGWIFGYLGKKILRNCPAGSITGPKIGQKQTTRASSIILLLWTFKIMNIFLKFCVTVIIVMTIGCSRIYYIDVRQEIPEYNLVKILEPLYRSNNFTPWYESKDQHEIEFYKYMRDGDSTFVGSWNNTYSDHDFVRIEHYKTNEKLTLRIYQFAKGQWAYSQYIALLIGNYLKKNYPQLKVDIQYITKLDSR